MFHYISFITLILNINDVQWWQYKIDSMLEKRFVLNSWKIAVITFEREKERESGVFRQFLSSTISDLTHWTLFISQLLFYWMLFHSSQIHSFHSSLLHKFHFIFTRLHSYNHNTDFQTEVVWSEANRRSSVLALGFWAWSQMTVRVRDD